MVLPKMAEKSLDQNGFGNMPRLFNLAKRANRLRGSVGELECYVAICWNAMSWVGELETNFQSGQANRLRPSVCIRRCKFKFSMMFPVFRK